MDAGLSGAKQIVPVNLGKKKKKRENASKIMPPDDREIITSLTKLVIRFDGCLSD